MESTINMITFEQVPNQLQSCVEPRPYWKTMSSYV